MPAALVTIALLALGFGLLRLSWQVHVTHVESSAQRRLVTSYRAFWWLTEGAGWLALVYAMARCFVLKQ